MNFHTPREFRATLPLLGFVILWSNQFGNQIDVRARRQNAVVHGASYICKQDQNDPEKKNK